MSLNHPVIMVTRHRSFALVLSLFALPGLALTAWGDWPQYRGPQGDGSTKESPAKEIITSTPAWRVPLNAGFSSFVSDGRQVYTLVARSHEGNEHETLVALDAATGEEKWAQALTFIRYGHDGGNSGARGNDGGDGPRSTPAVADGRVFAIDADLRVYAFDSATGEPLWKHDLMREFGGKNIKWKNAAAPLLDEGRLYMAGGGRNQAFLAFDQKTGALVWKSGKAEMTHATPVATTLGEQRQILFYNQDGITAVDAASGDVLWHHDVNFAVSTAASPVVDGDVVYCSAGYGVGATAFQVTRQGDSYTTKELWREPGNALANHWSTPVCHQGHLYGIFGFKEYGSAPLACVDIRTGKVLWREEGFGPGNVILAGSNLLVLGDAGQLALVTATPSGYQELAKKDVLEGKCWSTPIVCQGHVFARSTQEGICLAPGKGL